MVALIGAGTNQQTKGSANLLVTRRQIETSASTATLSNSSLPPQTSHGRAVGSVHPRACPSDRPVPRSSRPPLCAKCGKEPPLLPDLGQWPTRALLVLRIFGDGTGSANILLSQNN